MDIATPAGILIGALLLIVSIILGGGMSGIAGFINIPSIMIVIGGTISATLVRYPLQVVTGLVSLIMKTVFHSGKKRLDQMFTLQEHHVLLQL